VSTLEALAARGVQLAVISNWDRRLPDILRSLDIFEIFETVTVSSIEGVEKPSSEIFHRTIARLGIPATKTVHVGDSPLEDYSGAESAGLTSVLIDRHELFADESFRRVTSLEQILDLIA
jgi:putative hydrolase of the HAD superfamily